MGDQVAVRAWSPGRGTPRTAGGCRQVVLMASGVDSWRVIGCPGPTVRSRRAGPAAGTRVQTRRARRRDHPVPIGHVGIDLRDDWATALRAAGFQTIHRRRGSSRACSTPSTPLPQMPLRDDQSAERPGQHDRLRPRGDGPGVYQRPQQRSTPACSACGRPARSTGCLAGAPRGGTARRRAGGARARARAPCSPRLRPGRRRECAQPAGNRQPPGLRSTEGGTGRPTRFSPASSPLEATPSLG